MLTTLALASALSGNFVHPQPAPPADLPVAVYQGRRARLLADLGDCVAVISSRGVVEGITEDFRQDADFFWLTGINEPDAHLVLQPKSAYRKVVLFLKSRDPATRRSRFLWATYLTSSRVSTFRLKDSAYASRTRC